MAENCEIVKNLTNLTNNLNIKSENDVYEPSDNKLSQPSEKQFEKWGFPLQDLYKLGLKFYKGRNIQLFFLYKYHSWLSDDLSFINDRSSNSQKQKQIS